MHEAVWPGYPTLVAEHSRALWCQYRKAYKHLLDLTLTSAPIYASAGEVTQPPAHTFWRMDCVPEIIAQCKFYAQQNLLYLLEEDEPAVIAKTKFPFSISRKNRHIRQLLLWIILKERVPLHFWRAMTYDSVCECTRRHLLEPLLCCTKADA